VSFNLSSWVCDRCGETKLDTEVQYEYSMKPVYTICTDCMNAVVEAALYAASDFIAC
jgi:hypothetical protein